MASPAIQWVPSLLFLLPWAGGADAGGVGAVGGVGGVGGVATPRQFNPAATVTVTAVSTTTVACAKTVNVTGACVRFR